MSGAEDSREEEFKEASSKLNEGLETCRVVVETYRELLIGENPDGGDGDIVPATVEDEPIKISST